MEREEIERRLDLSWIIPGKLAALSCPYEDDLELLAELGIKVLVSLNERPPSTAAVREVGMEHYKLPFPDGTAPPIELIREFVGIVDRALKQGKPVAVHCLAGLGRTGTMIACYLVYAEGMDPWQAIDAVRRARPGSVENDSQERAVENWWRALHGWKTAQWR